MTTCSTHLALWASLSISSLASAAVWPKFAANLGNTATTPATPPTNLVATIVTNSPFLGVKLSSSLAVNYGRVFAYANGPTGTIFALDPDSLAVKWAVPVPVDDSWGWGSWATPSVMNSSVVFAADAYLGCWNLDGSLRWQTTLSHETVNSSPAIVGNRVIVGCFSYINTQGGLAAFDLATGSQLWFSVAIPNSTFSSCTPAVDEAAGRIYAACSNQVWCTDLATGQILWRASAPGAFLQLNNVSLASGLVFAVNYDFAFSQTNLFAFNAANGSFVWAAPCGMSDVPPAIADTIVIHSCGDNLVPPAITAFDLFSGSQLWQRTGLGSMYTPPAVAADVVYAAVGVYSGWSLITMSNLTALSVRDGRILSSTGTTRGGQAPAIADDVIYTANNGTVYAYRRPQHPIFLSRFSLSINTAMPGKDKLKLLGALLARFPFPDYGQPVYARLGDFVFLGEPLSFSPNPDRPYAASAAIVPKKTGLLLAVTAKNGSYANMFPNLPNSGTVRLRLPLVIITNKDIYFRSELDLTLRVKNGKVKGTGSMVL
ncbi:MAG: PQQ-like beta-propeller repeat protein [bacterium]|nr:PQQ-like beta-propeller repeat protein [bacterium]